MNCVSVREAITQAPVEELRGTFGGHLPGCKECTIHRDEMLALADDLASLRFSAPPELYPRVIASLPSQRRLTLRRTFTAAALAIAAIAVLAFSWYFTFGPGSRDRGTGAGDDSARIKMGSKSQSGLTRPRLSRPWPPNQLRN